MGDLKLINYKDRIVNFFTDVDEASVKEAIEKIQEINIKDDEYISNAISVLAAMGLSTDPGNIALPPITLNLSTYGGDVHSGFGLCDCIRMSDTSVKIVCYGKVMSMGIPILLSAHYKAAHKNTTFMIHDVSSFAWGKTQDMKESVEESERLQQMIMEYVCSRTKFPRKKYIEIIEKKKDFYFTAEDALKWKFIDEIIDEKPNEPEEIKDKDKKNKKQKNTDSDDGK